MAENPLLMYFVGTAGAGKSTLVAGYDRWCKQNGLSTVTVNLDPGAEALPYQPDIDIRETIDLPTVMEEHGLGPNGAQIAAADMIALQLTDLVEEINSYRADMVLIDTPGQVELFVFRLSGKLIVESIDPEHSAIVYCLDPYLARTATGFTSQMMLAATTQFRFNQPMVHALTKQDLVDEDSLRIIQDWGNDPVALENDVLAEEPSMSREMSAHVTRLLETMGLQNLLVPVTAADDTGMDELYAQVQAALGGSEDATPEYDTFLPHGQEEVN